MKLRPATLKDADQLREWRNDPDAVEASLSSRPVGEEEHFRWLREALVDLNQRVWIGVLDKAGWGSTDVGVVRARRDGGVAEVSVVVDPGWRLHGYARTMIEAAVEEMVATGFAERFLARVKISNSESLKAFHAAGFSSPDVFVTLRHDA